MNYWISERIRFKDTLAYLFLSIATICFIATSSSDRVSAHGSGPPYVKVNGVYAETHPVIAYTTPVAFEIGSDLASSSAFLVDEKIDFEIDEKFFPNPYRLQANPFGSPSPTESLPDPEFLWKFDDGGEPQEGSDASVSYSSPGTYLIRLFVRYPGYSDEYAEVNTIQIHIVPDMSYTLPVAEMNVNNQSIIDPSRDIIEIRAGQKITFDAEESTGDTLSYEWDFGDEAQDSGKTVHHRYKRDEYYPVFPVLRVTDENGLTSEIYAFLDTPLDDPNIFLKLYYLMFDSMTSLFD